MNRSEIFIPSKKTTDSNSLLETTGYCQQNVLLPMAKRVVANLEAKLKVGLQALRLQVIVSADKPEKILAALAADIKSYKQLPIVFHTQAEFYFFALDNAGLNQIQATIEQAIACSGVISRLDTDGVHEFFILNPDGKNIPLQRSILHLDKLHWLSQLAAKYSDAKGLLWPTELAPFSTIIVPLQYHKSYRVQEAVTQLCSKYERENVSFLFDDRKARPGLLLAEADLLGIPTKIVISERGLDNGVVERHCRYTGNVEEVRLDSLL